MKTASTLNYDVTIEAVGEKSLFRVTWQDTKDTSKKCFCQNLHFQGAEKREVWEKKNAQLETGQSLFALLDGQFHYLNQALDKAYRYGKTLRINLHTCQRSDDLPFELLANKEEFLLLRRLHLVRRVSRRGIKKKVNPRKGPLKLLFMSCSPKQKIIEEPDYNREEEEILRITEVLPVEMEVEESGSLGGLQRRLMHCYYDVVYLAGHAYIDGNELPFFQMENQFGGISRVYPETLWHHALIENPPRLLFLSGCRSGQGFSFARYLVEKDMVPAALGWASKVIDSPAAYAGKIMIQQLSRGSSIPEAVQRARHELHREFSGHSEPTWPLLRLYCDGSPLTGMVKKEQQLKPEPREMIYAFLEGTQVKILKEGFVGRRRQLQICWRALKEDREKSGLLILGPGGLGKTCLVGKICEGFSDAAVIVLEDKLEEIFLGKALKNIFIANGDKEGLRVLAQKKGITEKIKTLCAGSFRKKKYLLILDGFQQNLEGWDLGKPGLLQPKAAMLLDTLLCSLPLALKRTQLVITSRFSFTLGPHPSRDIIQKRLEPVWLTSFNLLEQTRKTRYLKNTWQFGNDSRNLLREIGAGNPLLMERLDDLAGEIPVEDEARLQLESKKLRKEFRRQMGLHELYGQAEETLKGVLKHLTLYHRWIPDNQLPVIEEKIGTKGVKKLLQEAIRLSLVEFDQYQAAYSLAPLLRDLLK